MTAGIMTDLDVADEWRSKELSDDDTEEDDQPQAQVMFIGEWEHHLSVARAWHFACEHLSPRDTAMSSHPISQN